MNVRNRRSHSTAVLVVGLILLCLPSRLFPSTTYTEPWTTDADSWSYTQLSCSGGATCTNGVATVGNPAKSVYAKVSVKSKVQTGYWKIKLTWEQMGVTAGNVIDTVDASWDDFVVATTSACTASTTAGIDLYDTNNSIRVTASQVEPDIDVHGDTSAFTNHNPTGAIAVSSSYQASNTTITLRMDSNQGSGGSTGSACELDTDNFTLVIVSHGAYSRTETTTINLGAESIANNLGRSRVNTTTIALGTETAGSQVACHAEPTLTVSLGESVEATPQTPGADNPRDLTATLSLSLSLGRVLFAGRAPTLTAPTTATLGRSLIAARAGSDTSSLSESLARTEGLGKSLTATIAGSESLARGLTATRADATNLSFSSALSRLVAFRVSPVASLHSSFQITSPAPAPAKRRHHHGFGFGWPLIR